MKTDKATVYANAFLKKYRGQNFWIIKNCPYCHTLHQHGGGMIGENPRDYLGWRLSHCIPGIAGKGSKPFQYYLREVESGKEKSKKEDTQAAVDRE